MSKKKKLIILASGLLCCAIALATVVLLDSRPACATSAELEASYAAEWQIFKHSAALDPSLSAIADDRGRLSLWCQHNAAAAPGLCARASMYDCDWECRLGDNDMCDWDWGDCDACRPQPPPYNYAGWCRPDPLGEAN